MGLVDRINRAAAGDEQRGDVAPMVTAHQGRIPLAYTSQMVLPDQATLAAFMNARLNDLNGLLLTTRQ